MAGIPMKDGAVGVEMPLGGLPASPRPSFAAEPPPGAAAIAADASLRKALEWELGLDGRDLRSHAWYHGAIPRQRAEEVLGAENGSTGDFLVRDCTSRPGDFVLSVRATGGQILHFVVTKVAIRADTVYERVQYQFEDDAYDTVPDLITFYVGSGKPISKASGARILTPRNRLYPLSFYAAKYGPHLTSPSPPRPARRPSIPSAPHHHFATAPRLPAKRAHQHGNANSGSTCNTDDDGGGGSGGSGGGGSGGGGSADGVLGSSVSGATDDAPSRATPLFSAHSLPRASGSGGGRHPRRHPLSTPPPPPARAKMVRVTSDPALSPRPERRASAPTAPPQVPRPPRAEDGTPPPKPGRPPPLAAGDAAAEGVPPIAQIPCGHAAFRVHHASGSDSGNGSGDSAQSSVEAEGQQGVPGRGIGVVIRNPRHSQMPPIAPIAPSDAMPLGAPSYEEIEAALMQSVQTQPRDWPHQNAYDLENFQTLLLPSLENKPLDSTALRGVRLMLKETGPRVLANHLTRVDLYTLLMVPPEDISTPTTPKNAEPKSEIGEGNGDETNGSGEGDIGVENGNGRNGGESSGCLWDGYEKRPGEVGGPAVCSGIELVTLPHGHQMRVDLVERTECLKLMVAVTILTCPTQEERAEALHKWIQVAVETKTALGNLFGFCAVMMGLCMPQVERLTATWHVLRQRHTDSAFNFEAKLRPTLKSMNECTNPQAPNTTIPHLLPIALLHERALDDLNGIAPEGLGPNETPESKGPRSHLYRHSCLQPWESSSADFGLSTLHSHLEASRKFGAPGAAAAFRRNAEIVLGSGGGCGDGVVTPKVDQLLMDAFRTEFHLKFLWGSRGATVESSERHAKFERVLNLMSEKCEPPPLPPSPSSTPVMSACP
ncbi:breast cancer anti-estrogen resistance protein 3 homolog [Hetaerina americana]|uniref:breast cancer anti-estrogen resistance protein 3 homolog n=1 Tax=Hetaerina americana TaxID=62018 RepID=UPI003A7F3778